MGLESKLQSKGFLSKIGNKIKGSLTSKILAYSLAGSLAFGGSALFLSRCGSGGGGGGGGGGGDGGGDGGGESAGYYCTDQQTSQCSWYNGIPTGGYYGSGPHTTYENCMSECGSGGGKIAQCTDPDYPLACPSGACCGEGYPYHCNDLCYSKPCSGYEVCKYEDALYIFGTSLTYGGNLGGLAGADKICNNHATGAGLPGIYKAWLSDSTSNAIDRISGNGPWVLVNGFTKVFNNKANMSTSPANSISLDEHGNNMPIGYSVLTGTNIGGISSGKNCNNWTSALNTYSATIGDGYSNNGWTDGWGDESCDRYDSTYQYHLYCIEIR